MSEPNNNKVQSKSKISNPYRADKLKEIDLLYRKQLDLIYKDSKMKIQKQEEQPKREAVDGQKRQNNVKKQVLVSPQLTSFEKQLQTNKSASTLYIPDSVSNSKYAPMGFEGEDKVRASTLLKGQSTRTIQILRRENQTKQLKIRQLSHKCQNLIQKLKKHLGSEQFEAQIENLKEYSDTKMERLENLFKIKQQEIFFKIKLQVIALLQQFSIPKQDLAQLNDVANESNLFIFMARKLKNRLKDFRSQAQESNFQIQKDKILSQNQEERIHYITETNQLLKLSQQKLKSKIQDLKGQLNQYIEKLKLREHENEQNQNEIFRLRKQNEQLQTINQKLNTSVRGANGERIDQRRMWEAKQKQMKLLLNNYFIQKKKLQTQLEEKAGEIEQNFIKIKFLQQEKERLNRELVRLKQRYQWLQKDKDLKLRESQQQKNSIQSEFEQYKQQHNQSIIMALRSEIDEAIRRVEEYQRAYQSVLLELQQEKRLIERSEEQNEDKFQRMEREWLDRVKRLQKMKQQQVYEMGQDCQNRIRETRQEFEKKQRLLAEEMQARMKALLAEKDKKATEQLIELETENDQLRREIDDLNKIIEVKESLINVINSKKLGS